MYIATTQNLPKLIFIGQRSSRQMYYICWECYVRRETNFVLTIHKFRKKTKITQAGKTLGQQGLIYMHNDQIHGLGKG